MFFDILAEVGSDLFRAIGANFTGGDYLRLAMLVAIGALGALSTKSLGNAFSAALWGLPVFAVASYVRTALTMTSADAFGRSPWLEALAAGWDNIAGMRGIELFGLYGALALIVMILYLLKGAISRG